MTPDEEDGEAAPPPSLRAFGPGVVSAIVLFAAGFRMYTRNADAALQGFDENIYRVFAETMGERGLAGVRDLIERFHTDKQLSIGPPPLRVFNTFASVVACKLFGGYTTQHLAWLSWVAAIATIAVLHVTLRAWFRDDRRIPWVATLLVASSPLATALGRRALSDSLAALLVISALALFEHAREKPRRGPLVALSAVLVAGLLTKEGLIVTFPAFAVLAWVHARNGDALPRSLALPFVVAPIVAVVTLAYVAGGTDKLAAAYSAYVDTSEKIPYANHFQRGPWFRYVVDFALIAPLPLVLAVAGTVAPSERGARGAQLSAAFVVPALLAFSLLSMLNVRFVLFADSLVRALAAVALARLASFIARMRGIADDSTALLVCALVVSALDLQQFDRIFVQGNVYDPITANLVEANGMFRK